MVMEIRMLHGLTQYNYMTIMDEAFEGDRTSSSSTKFTMRSTEHSNFKIVVYGTGLDFDGDNLVAGTVKQMEIYKGDKLVGEFSNINAFFDAAGFWASIQDYDPSGPLFDDAFQDFFGSKDDDVFIDNDFEGFLYGKGGDDELTGNGGGDKLDGGTGTNLLHGGAGADIYVFKTKNGVNVIDEFDASDTFRLSKDAFKGIGLKGTINPDLIEFGVETASDADTRFFIQADGDFYYDSNGSGSGHRTLIAQFPNDAPEDFAAFFVIA